jgi:peptidoglycan/xylan/chitin deacetylase (PgdA/CDA1 family)
MSKWIFGAILFGMGFALVFFINRPKTDIIYSVETRQKMVALTFDDGPHPVYTGQILDILRKYHAKATFFMVGVSMKTYPFLVEQVIAAGHSIGNHTYSHPRNLAVCSKPKIEKEIQDCQKVIRKLTGESVLIFRPPRGRLNRKVVQIAKKNGYQIVLWSICGDRRTYNPQRMARRVIQNIHSGDIILLHDGTFDSRWKDVEATGFIVKALTKKGYRFVTVPELLKLTKEFSLSLSK